MPEHLPHPFRIHSKSSTIQRLFSFAPSIHVPSPLSVSLRRYIAAHNELLLATKVFSTAALTHPSSTQILSLFLISQRFTGNREALALTPPPLVFLLPLVPWSM